MGPSLAWVEAAPDKSPLTPRHRTRGWLHYLVMCGRYTLTNPSDLAGRFGLGALAETRIEPRFNIAPAQLAPIVVADEQGRALERIRWGYQPAWMQQSKRPPPINARAETLLQRPLFRGALNRARCIVPVSGFYEWQVLTEAKLKQPWYFRCKDRDLLGFAGLSAHDAEGQRTFLIIATEANELLAPIHNRMPVILTAEAEERWLDRDAADSANALGLLLTLDTAGKSAERTASRPATSATTPDGPTGPPESAGSAARHERLSAICHRPKTLPAVSLSLITTYPARKVPPGRKAAPSRVLGQHRCCGASRPAEPCGPLA
jgi:putative SOS response-associated peptidase YedK